MPAVHSSSQASSVCSGTWLCTKRVQTSGSRPMASRMVARSNVCRRSSAEVWLSSIVDAYVSALESMRGLDLEVATEFLLSAAILLELKARRLLPGRDDVELDEELALWEERDLLLARLFECKTFKDAAAALNQLAEDAERSHPRTAGPDERFISLTPDVLAGVTPEALRAALIRAATPRPTPR